MRKTLPPTTDHQTVPNACLFTCLPPLGTTVPSTSHRALGNIYGVQDRKSE